MKPIIYAAIVLVSIQQAFAIGGGGSPSEECKGPGPSVALVLPKNLQMLDRGHFHVAIWEKTEECVIPQLGRRFNKYHSFVAVSSRTFDLRSQEIWMEQEFVLRRNGERKTRRIPLQASAATQAIGDGGAITDFVTVPSLRDVSEVKARVLVGGHLVALIQFP
jgi:hypothetical protein